MLLNEMEIFYYVVELKSFSKAAERLDVSKSFISKKMAKLEQDLKLRLITRSTRQFVLTEAGENFYHYCASIVSEGEKAYSMMSELQWKPSGLLKISIPSALGLHLISPLLPKFLTKYPEIKLDIELENRLVDLIEEGYDLALRSAKLESSNLVAKRLLNFTSVICATENYLKKHGVPKKTSDLSAHNFAIYSSSKDSAYIEATINKRKEVTEIQGNFMSNHLDLVKCMILNDSCIGLLPEFMVANELAHKKLIRCLPDYQLPQKYLYAIYPEREFMLPRLKLFLDFLEEKLGKHGGIT